MQTYRDVVANLQGVPVVGASILVKLLSNGFTDLNGGTLATIYDGLGNSIANPITSVDGSFAFAAANGKYTITVTVNGQVSNPVGPVELYDPVDAPVATLAALAANAGSSLIGFIAAGLGTVLRFVQDKLRERISTLDYGADPTGAADSTAAIQAAVTAAGLARKLYHPYGTYKISGTIVKPAGQIWEGDGWSTVTGSYALAGGSVLMQMSAADVPMIQIVGADDSHQVERGGFRDIALIHSVTNSTTGTGIQALNSRQQQLDNVYAASFNVGIEQGMNSWQWAMRNVRVFDASKCLYTHDEGEDSTYTSCVFRSYRSGGIAVHMKNMSQTNLFDGCDMSNSTTGALMEQGDTNGNGTGTPYPMHATYINCQFENNASEAIKMVSSNGSASNKLHPQAILIGCRAYNSDNPNAGQIVVNAQRASLVQVVGLQSSGYSYGISIGTTVGQVIWKPGPGAQFGSADAIGQFDRIFDVPNCRLQSTALAYTSGNFTTIPYTTVVSDVAGWYSATAGIKPARPGPFRAKASIYVDAAPIGRYVLILKTNGGSDATLADFYVSTAGQALLLPGDLPVIAGGADVFTVVLFSTASFSVDPVSSFFSLEPNGG